MKILFPFLGFLCFSLISSAQVYKKSDIKGLAQLFDESAIFNQIFTGFALYDPDASTMLFEREANKYFTPASNTKIFTLYTSMKVLGDSIITLRYMERGDSLIFWGTGNPLFLHPSFPTDTAAFAFLKNTDKKLFFSIHNFEEERFGPGWAWDDYSGYYQAENSPLPVYSNMAVFSREEVGDGMSVQPLFFKAYLSYDMQLPNDRVRIVRAEHNNNFYFNGRAMTGIPFEKVAPFRVTPKTVAALLSDTLQKEVKLYDGKLPELTRVQSVSGPIPDSLYRKLMQESDNFIAEQLILSCSEKLSGQINTAIAITYAKDSLMADMPDELVWRDGSGLSRYNLFTPRTVISVLDSLYKMVPQARLMSIFPAGGVSGTIIDYYKGDEAPYVFAKTGTLSNKHCLSGYIKAKSGKWYIFSFMNNNYVNGTKPVKQEMEKILKYIYTHY